MFTESLRFDPISNRISLVFVDGFNNILGIFTDSRDVTSDPAESIDSICAAKSPGDLLLSFHHAQITFGQVIIKRHCKVIHTGKKIFTEVFEK